MVAILRSLLAGICMVCAGITVGGCNYSGHDDFGQLWGMLGAGVVDTIKNAESVEYYKVAPAMPAQGTQTYEAAGKVQKLSDDEVMNLRKLVLNDNHYLFGVLKKCVFVPETAFRFNKGGKSVLLLVSMNCKQVTYDLGDQKVRLDIDPSAESFAEFIGHLSN